MPGGRPRKPDARKILEGDRPDRINRNAPKPTADIGPIPEQIADDEVAAKCWVRMVRLLTASKVLASTDADQLAIYCSVFSTWIKARELVDQEGLMVPSQSGWKANPMLAVIRASEARMGTILGQFGMTPAARSALNLGGDGDDDDFDQFNKARPTGPKPPDGPTKAPRKRKDPAPTED